MKNQFVYLFGHLLSISIFHWLVRRRYLIKDNEVTIFIFALSDHVSSLSLVVVISTVVSIHAFSLMVRHIIWIASL